MILQPLCSWMFPCIALQHFEACSKWQQTLVEEYSEREPNTFICLSSDLFLCVCFWTTDIYPAHQLGKVTFLEALLWALNVKKGSFDQPIEARLEHKMNVGFLPAIVQPRAALTKPCE